MSCTLRPIFVRRAFGLSGALYAQQSPEVPACMARGALADVFGSAASHDVPALVTSFRSEVYDVVGTLDDFQVVLYDDDRMPTFDEGIEGGQQFPDVVEVQSRGRLVKDEYCGCGFLLPEVVSQLDPLVFATRKGGGGLAELDVSKPHVLQRLEHGYYAPLTVSGKELYRLVDGHVEDVVDVLSLIPYVKYVLLEASAVATFAFEDEVGHELHLHRNGAFALTLFAASATCVETEERSRIPHLLCQWLLSEQTTYLVPCLYIRHGIRTAALSYWILVDKLYRTNLPEVAFQG